MAAQRVLYLCTAGIKMRNRRLWPVGRNRRMEQKTERKPDQKTDQSLEAKDVIQVRDLYKVYRMGDTKVYALNGVSFGIPRGGFCAITGPSGSGKSTLLNMLAGLEHPSKGEIVIAGKHIEKLNESQLVKFRRERVGFIFQSYNLIATMNALENVALPLSFRGVPRDVRLKKAKQYLQLVVGIARALVVNPQIIFADEPTGNLDSKTTMEVLKLMQQIVREQNQTLVMVTHDNNLATYADRIFKIIDGKIVHIEENRRTPDEEETRELPGLI